MFKRVATLLVSVGLLSLVACGAATAASSSVLPRNWIVPLKTVERFFPQVTRAASTGKNTTSSGKPIASRQVIYANRDASQKVTLSVDQYKKPEQALAALKDAADKSKDVPGFSPLPEPDVGQQGSAGTVTQGDETHVGVAAQQGSLIIQVTIAGYDASHVNISKTVALTRVEVAAAKRKCADEQGCAPS